MSEFFKTAAIQAAGVRADHPMADMLSLRADIFTMTDQAQNAALTPDAPGGLSHGVRAALACRMCRLNREDGLSAHFEALMEQTGAPEEVAQIADTSYPGGESGAGKRLDAIIRHTDLATRDAKSVTGGDIAALAAAGISEDDIVRLSELIAFVNYQVRLVIGLRLMGDLS